MGKTVSALFLCSLMAIGCGGVSGEDEDQGETGEPITPVTPPPDEGEGGEGEEGEDEPVAVDINSKVCSIERFDAASGELIYRDVRTYYRDRDILIMDRDTDGDGVMNDQYRYVYAGGAYSTLQIDRDRNGQADYLRTYVHDGEGRYDYYLQDNGVQVDGVWELSLDWNYVIDYRLDENNRTIATIYDNTVDLNFEDQGNDFLYRYDYERDEDSGRTLSVTRTRNSELGVDYYYEYVWEGDVVTERHYDLGVLDGVYDRSEFRVHDVDGRIEQIHHDRDGDGNMDWIERRSYEGC